MCHVGKIHNDVGEMLKLQDVVDESFAPEDEFDDSDDIDDGIDPAMKEKIDRWVCLKFLWISWNTYEYTHNVSS